MKAKTPTLNDAGMHAFEGNCAPGDTPKGPNTFSSFSLGIFEWVPKASGKGVKRGKVKVRVSGPMSNPRLVYARAREIVKQLDKGTYNGTKHVQVKPQAEKEKSTDDKPKSR